MEQKTNNDLEQIENNIIQNRIDNHIRNGIKSYHDIPTRKKRDQKTQAQIDKMWSDLDKKTI